MYFIALMFLEIHSFTIQRGNPTLLFIPGEFWNYQASWRSENSSQCTDGDKKIFMSDDGQAYKCTSAATTGMSVFLIYECLVRIEKF